LSKNSSLDTEHSTSEIYTLRTIFVSIFKVSFLFSIRGILPRKILFFERSLIFHRSILCKVNFAKNHSSSEDSPRIIDIQFGESTSAKNFRNKNTPTKFGNSKEFCSEECTVFTEKSSQRILWRRMILWKILLREELLCYENSGKNPKLILQISLRRIKKKFFQYCIRNLLKKLSKNNTTFDFHFIEKLHFNFLSSIQNHGQNC
jgi:hypothetical protein